MTKNERRFPPCFVCCMLHAAYVCAKLKCRARDSLRLSVLKELVAVHDVQIQKLCEQLRAFATLKKTQSFILVVGCHVSLFQTHLTRLSHCPSPPCSGCRAKTRAYSLLNICGSRWRPRRENL